METPGVGMGIRYENVDAGYLESRKLKKSAGWILLWALGVGAVISGDFGGWNLGLAAGGFGGLAIATVLMTIMYVCMVYSIAELSAALPHAGGFYSFARNSFGPWGGMIVGISDTIEYVITPATIVFFIGGYMETLLPSVPLWVWWAGFYAVFLALNILGVELTFKVGLAVTALAIVVLVVFYVSALVSGAFKPALLFNIPPAAGGSAFLPNGTFGIFAAIPFAIWFYLAIEQLPLAAEETKDVVTNMPKALIYGIITLMVLTLGTLVLNTGVGGGAVAMGASAAPLSDGFKAIFGDTITTVLFTLIALLGLVASFHTVIYAAGRVLFALSRSGYYPRWISVTGKENPHTVPCPAAERCDRVYCCMALQGIRHDRRCSAFEHVGVWRGDFLHDGDALLYQAEDHQAQHAPPLQEPAGPAWSSGRHDSFRGGDRGDSGRREQPASRHRHRHLLCGDAPVLWAV